MSDNPATEVRAETVTAKSYIATLLQRLVSERLLINVSLPAQGDAPLTSTVLQVLPNKGEFLLDDLFPQPKSEMLKNGTEIALHAAFEGVTLQLTTAITSMVDQNGLRLLRLAFPEAIDYQRTRQTHRINVLPLEIPVYIAVGEGVVLKGQLDDASLDGMAIRMAKVSGLKRGKVYRCRIEHSEHESVEVEIEPTHVSKVEGTLPIKLGANLHNMSKHDQWQWQRFTAELERHLIRQH